MPQVTTSSEAGPGTRIIYCFIIHICLQWNIYMRMDNSSVHFIRVAGGTFRRWIYPDNPPRLPLDIQMIEMCFKPASHWPASRALIGRYAEEGPADWPWALLYWPALLSLPYRPGRQWTDHQVFSHKIFFYTLRLDRSKCCNIKYVKYQ